MRVLVTGSAGFIGFHIARRLVADGHLVVGFDGMTPYYDVRLKERRHAILAKSNGFRAKIGQLEDKAALDDAVADCRPDVIIHLAAQAGVRYSLEHPEAYVSANLDGMFNLLEAARVAAPKHLLIASTSSVYGGNSKMPFRETDRADWPMTLYAATKKAGEAMSHSYAHLWKLPTTCFRFFTVYGPWGRPDMAPIKFVSAIDAGRPIEVYGDGQMRRDFTYIDDLVEAVMRLIDIVPEQGKPTRGRRRRGFAVAGGAVARRQHCRRPAGLADAVHRDDRAPSRQAGQQDHAADAEGRRHGNLCRRLAAAGADRLHAGDHDRPGRQGAGRLVSRGHAGRSRRAVVCTMSSFFIAQP